MNRDTEENLPEQPEENSMESSEEAVPLDEVAAEASEPAAEEAALEAASEQVPEAEMHGESEVESESQSETEETSEEIPVEAATEEVPVDDSSEETTALEALEAGSGFDESASDDVEAADASPALSADAEEGAEPAHDGPTAPSHPLPKPSDLTAVDLVPILEAILFAADRPVSVERMRAVIAPKPEEDSGPEKPLFHQALELIRERYEQHASGFELREAHGGFHFVSRAPFAEYIRRYQASKPFRLGRAAMETLAIIAYREPITRAEIDQVRGMDSSHLMRTLIERGLVRMAGKAEVPGRPVLYATTPRFLEVMGLNSLNDLPPLSELKQLEGDVDDPMRRMEQGMDKFMRPDPHAMPLAATADNADPSFDPGLSEIDALIQAAGKPQEEVFASKVHQEVALANQEALEAFQASMPRRRKRTTVTYDELVGGEAQETPAAEATPAENTAAMEVEASVPPPTEEPTEDPSAPAGNA